jgi:hypothetical protein
MVQPSTAAVRSCRTPKRMVEMKDMIGAFQTE